MDRQTLLTDLYRAYKDARRHKRGKTCQLEFEYDLERNLLDLCDELLERRYKPRPSICFIIHDPKMREVFAADFRDRIVHHLFCNYTCHIFERTFISDSYSCLKGRGTHYGVSRLRHHILGESRNYTRPCHVLKVDIRGYFMHINRERLLAMCRRTLAGNAAMPSERRDLTDYLLSSIISADPTEGCIVKGDPREWNRLPPDKSLFTAPPGCGLPIGNLSSQLFSNVYLNAFDQFCKRGLKARRYGRYVDDAFFVSTDKEFLKSLTPRVRSCLSEELGLRVNEGKVRIYDAYQGVQFLGAYLRPYRTYIAHDTLRRVSRKMRALTAADPHRLRSTVNSCLGVLSHCDSFLLRRDLFAWRTRLPSLGSFSADCLRYTPRGL